MSVATKTSLTNDQALKAAQRNLKRAVGQRNLIASVIADKALAGEKVTDRNLWAYNDRKSAAEAKAVVEDRVMIASTLIEPGTPVKVRPVMSSGDRACGMTYDNEPGLQPWKATFLGFEFGTDYNLGEVVALVQQDGYEPSQVSLLKCEISPVVSL